MCRLLPGKQIQFLIFKMKNHFKNYLDILHPLPLVDEHGLVAVHEPGEVLQPLQPDGDGAVLEEQPSEQHQGDKDGGANGQSDVDVGSGTGDHVSCQRVVIKKMWKTLTVKKIVFL